MNVLFLVAGRLPYPTGNGTSVLWNGLLECFRRMGASLTVVPVAVHYDRPEQEQRHEDYLRKSVHRFVELPRARELRSVRGLRELFRRAVDPREQDFFLKDEETRRRLRELVLEEKIDVVVGCDWASLPLTHDLPVRVRVASLVDPVRQTLALRMRSLRRLPWRKRALDLVHLISERKISAIADGYLRGHQVILEHAHHHATELRERGVHGVHYLPHPLATPEPAEARGNERPARVLLIGSLKGTASRSGLEYLARELLPRVVRLAPKRTFEIRIVGHGTMDPRVKAELDAWPEVRLIGFVEDAEPEFRAADFVLVTVQSRFGFRTRIAESFGRGLCVVAHGANCAGMPEIADGVNALTSEGADGLAVRFVRALEDAELRRRIGAAARTTFIDCYSIESATRKLRDWLGAAGVDAGG